MIVGGCDLVGGCRVVPSGVGSIIINVLFLFSIDNYLTARDWQLIT